MLKKENKFSKKKKISNSIYEQVPEGYYERSIKSNILQWYWHKKRFEKIKRLVSGRIFKLPILDLGCNDGFFTSKISEYLGTNNITGIDISQNAVDYATKRFPQLRFIRTDACELPFENNKFGTIFSLEMLEHLEFPEIAVAEMKRCLKNNGNLIIIVPNDSLLFKIIWFCWLKSKGKVWEHAHLAHFNKKRILKLLEEQSFAINKIMFFHLRMLILIEARVKEKSFSVFENTNKNFYKKILDYDWVKANDIFSGPETFFHRLRVSILMRLLGKLDKKEKILDAGCGTGLFLRKLPPGSYGIDISMTALVKAKNYAPNAKIFLSDIEKMPFKNNFFDTILCTEVLEHLPNPDKALEEIRRVLKKNGRFIGSVPSSGFLWKFQKLSKTGPVIPYHKHYRSCSEVESILTDFDIEKIIKTCAGMLFIFVCRKK